MGCFINGFNALAIAKDVDSGPVPSSIIAGKSCFIESLTETPTTKLSINGHLLEAIHTGVHR